jgi:hypothetical protein
MVQRGQRPRFAIESGETLWVGGHLLWQHLDGHLPRQVCIGGAINFAHSAGAYRRRNLKRTEAGAGGQCHGFR